LCSLLDGFCFFGVRSLISSISTFLVKCDHEALLRLPKHGAEPQSAERFIIKGIGTDNSVFDQGIIPLQSA
jgi:hypothetical protein